MPEAQKHTGGCHCGQVRYEVETDLGMVISCNCSICSKKGLLLAFVPAENFLAVSGESALVDYQFNKHVVHHLSCARCGVESFARGQMPDGTPMVAINVRCLDGVDLSALTLTPFDGRSR
jgi:hypothetical protein